MLFLVFLRFVGQLHILRCFQDLLDSSCRCTGAGVHDEHSGHGQHGVQDDGKIGQECDNDTGLGAAFVDTVGSHQNNQGQTDIQQQVHHWVGDTHADGSAAFAANHLSIDLCKMFLLLFDLGKRLDDADSGDAFPHGAHHHVDALLQVAVHRNTLAGDQPYHQCDERQDRNHHQCQHRLHRHGDADAADEQNRCTDSHSLHHSDDLVDVIGVGGQAGFQRRDGKLVDLPTGQIGYFFKQIVAYRPGGISCDRCCHAVCIDVHQQCQHGTNRHVQSPDQHPFGVFERDDVVQDVRKHPWNQQFDHRSQKLGQNPNAHTGHIRF